MKKNLYYMSLLLGLVFGMTMFTACGGDDDDNNNAPSNPTTGNQDVSQTENMFGIPLTMEAISDGTFTIENGANGIITYRVDGGTPQTIAAKTEVSIPVTAGQKVAFYGDNDRYRNHGAGGETNFNGSADFYLYGNIMSLITSTDYATAKTLTAEKAFEGIFCENYETLRSHPSKPLVLPATTLSTACYSGMFQHCHNLTIAPELPATTLAERCYEGMFSFCRSLTTAPKLSATVLAKQCYQNMFNSCESLTTAPELPATKLAKECYKGMFTGCTNLTIAPVLPATGIAIGCYNRMFNGCTKLNAVTCLAEDISEYYCEDWLDGVAETGTFVKTVGIYWPSGKSGIPSGWTIIED